MYHRKEWITGATPSARAAKITRPGTLLLAVMLAACALSQSCAATGRYFKNRANDLADVVTIEGSVGPGVHALVQATDFLGAGVGHSVQYGFWAHGRHAGFGFRKTTGMLVLSNSKPDYSLGADPNWDTWLDTWDGLVGTRGASVEPKNDSVLESWDKQKNSEQGSLLFFIPLNASRLGTGDYHFGLRSFDLTASASALVGLHVTLSPGELADFVIGWSSVDVGHDADHGDAK
jgi:hypothetical protein